MSSFYFSHVHTGPRFVPDGFHTFAIDGAWQPTREAPQSGDRTAEFAWAWRRYIVTSEYGVVFHGDWRDMESAQRFARSMSSKAVASEVAPYRYCPAWGALS